MYKNQQISRAWPVDARYRVAVREGRAREDIQVDRRPDVRAELHERFEALCRRSLYDVNLVVLFLDAIYLPVRASGPKEGVIWAWGITENGARELVSVRLGAREAKEDWVELGRDLISHGLTAPRLVVADGAPGLTSAVEEICRAPIGSIAPFTA